MDAVKGDKDLEDKIKNGSFGGGLKYDYNHAMYIYDLDNMEEGMMIWEASNGQWKGLEDQKDPVWKKLVEKNKNPKYPCPISSFDKGYPVEIQKKKGPKTEYVFSIDILGDSLPLDEKQLTDLVKAPLLTDIVKRYTKYHLGATIEFLKQYDETIGQIMSNEEMVNAIEILKGELPADDTSSFSFKKGDNGNDEPDDTITYDKLSAMYDDLTGKGITDKSDEGQNLRSLIAEYIKSRNLSVKVERKKTNMALLDEIEAELEALGEEPSAKTSQSTSVNPKEEKEGSISDGNDENDEEDNPNQDSTAEPAVGRRRRK